MTEHPSQRRLSDLAVAVGAETTFAKTVSESDVYLFAGITGDLSPNHVDAEAMARSPYGRRIAHGALLVGYMSACSTALCAGIDTPGETAVSAGYDRIWFLAPVFIGDTISIVYRVREVDHVRRRTLADVELSARGELCAVAVHVLRWVAD